MSQTLSTLLTRAMATSQAAWKAERRGEYEIGLLHFSDRWAEPAFEPDCGGLPDDRAAELKLRFASLLGYQGHLKKIPDSQRRACDLLTEALGVFERHGQEEKCAECENHIALTYSRTGEYAEARIWLEAASRRVLGQKNIHRLATLMYGMLIDISEQKFESAVKIYENVEPLIRGWADDWIGAAFYLNAGVAIGEVGTAEKALECFELAAMRAERSSIKPLLASIQNELAHVYSSLGRYEKAHASVDKGIELYRDIGDESREGMLLDTKAAISLAEGKFDDGLRTIELAISILKDGENRAFLAEAYVTEAKILLWLDCTSDALVTLFEGVRIAETYSGRQFARALISQFEKELAKLLAGSKPGDRRSNGIEDTAMELVLPHSLAAHTTYQVIRVNNDFLECAGIGNGSLIVAADDAEIERGDLVAVRELESGEVSCGFYDLDFGVLCIETCDLEPRLFDPASVNVIGKIIGIVGEADGKGVRHVTPVDGRRPTS